MTVLRLLPDAERVLSTYLRSRSEVTNLVEQRVYTDMPAARVYPLVRLTRVGGSPLLDVPLWLDQPLIQVDVWGGPKVLARQVAETCRAVISVIHLASHDDAVVSGPVFGDLQWLPDDSFEPAKPRYQFDVQLTTHPK